jgi:hypothetical protein
MELLRLKVAYIITYIVHTYGIIKIKGSLHHTIAKLEHYFTIAFSGAFLTLAERSFSKLKLVKNYLRSPMSHTIA